MGAGTYGIFAYFMATLIVSIPINLLSSVVLMSILQLFIQWQGNMVLIWLSMFIVQMVGVAWGLTVGFATGDVQIAQSFAPAVIVPQIYLAGFYRPTENMAGWMRWLQWVSGMMYGYKSMLILEFGDAANHFDHEVERRNLNRAKSLAEFDAMLATHNVTGDTREALLAHSKQAADKRAADTLAQVRAGFFTNNGINNADPHQDLLFYMMLSLALFTTLCVAGMISLKISAMRR